jgi:transposase
MALQPHRVKYWLNPEGPDFDKKAAKIRKLYVSPPANTTVLSVDEKPGIQALRRCDASTPLALSSQTPGAVRARIRVEGHPKPLRAFNIKTGQVLVWSTPSRAIPWVLSFLDQILNWVRHGPLSSSPTTSALGQVMTHVAGSPGSPSTRVRFVFTPKHGSWLNQVEIWFSILSSKALRCRSSIACGRWTNHSIPSRYWNSYLRSPIRVDLYRQDP